MSLLPGHAPVMARDTDRRVPVKYRSGFLQDKTETVQSTGTEAPHKNYAARVQVHGDKCQRDGSILLCVEDRFVHQPVVRRSRCNDGRNGSPHRRSLSLPDKIGGVPYLLRRLNLAVQLRE